MPTTITKATEHQRRWAKLVRDPALQDLPYKVETNSRGQIVLSPQKNRHSVFQKAVQDLLDEHAPEGLSPPELAIATPQGVKVPDVAWMSPQCWERMQQTGDPSTLAPEICVEVMSDSNTWAEMEEKRSLYLEAGAEEVWVVSEEGQVRFFRDEEMETSELAPDVPSEL
jgi:Uma2 family endonuclease